LGCRRLDLPATRLNVRKDAGKAIKAMLKELVAAVTELCP
jgi:hypothetical protein